MLLHICHLHIHDVNLWFHQILKMLYWVEIWSLWRPFQCSELQRCFEVCDMLTCWKKDGYTVVIKGWMWLKDAPLTLKGYNWTPTTILKWWQDGSMSFCCLFKTLPKQLECCICYLSPLKVVSQVEAPEVQMPSHKLSRLPWPELLNLYGLLHILVVMSGYLSCCCLPSSALSYCHVTGWLDMH